MIEFQFQAPSKPLSENESRSMHWAQRYRRLRSWSQMTNQAMSLIPNKKLDALKNKRLEVQVFIPFQRNARRDPHNYIGTNVKTIIDAIVTFGLIDDDTTDYIKVLEPILVIDKNEIVIVRLKQIEKEGKK